MLVKINKIKSNTNNQINFTSKVTNVYPPSANITQQQKDFIDRFEEYGDYYSRTNYLNCKFLGEGVCSKAYYSKTYDFVIKENKPNPYIPKKSFTEEGTLYHENSILNSLEKDFENSQKGIALLHTEKDGQFLLSTLVQGKPANIDTNPYTQKTVSRLLRTLYRLDKNGVVNTDLSGANVLLTSNQEINLIDYQWAEKTKFTKDNYSYKLIKFPEFEAPANDVMFERAGLAGYLDDLADRSVYQARNFLKMYLGEKAHFCEKRADKIQKELDTRGSNYYNASESTVKERIEFEKLKAEIFLNPPESVMDTEILKINMLKQQRKAHAYFDKNVNEPRNILMGIPYSLRAYFSANELTQRAKEEQTITQDPKLKKYFSYMERYGDYWQGNFRSWYPATFNWVYNVVTGKEKDDFKRYFPGKLTDFKEIQDLAPMLYNQKQTDFPSESVFYKPTKIFRPLSLYGYKYSNVVDSIFSTNVNKHGSVLQAFINEYCLAHIESELNKSDKYSVEEKNLKPNIDNFISNVFFYPSEATKSDIFPKVFNDSKFWKLKSLANFRGNLPESKPLGRKLDIKEDQDTNKPNTSKILLITAGAVALGIAAVAIFRNKNKKTSPISFEGHPQKLAADEYKNIMVKGLKNKFNIDINPGSLKSIMGATEFREVIKKYSPEDFSLGNPKSQEHKDFFKNVIDGKFRISLHSHSVFSDGHMTPQNFIDMAAKYADKVAKKLPKEDTKPAFIIALTDHDNFEGCQEVVKIIAENPEKYKNLKFVPGAELSVREGDKHFDLTALGVNPFDENLNKYTEELKNKRAKSAQHFIKRVNDITGQDLKLEDLEKIDYKGKKTLHNRSGVVYIRNVMKAVLGKSDANHHGQIKNIFKERNYSDRDIPDIGNAIGIVKNAGGTLALTHPAKSFPNCNINWYKGLLQNLKNKGVSGIEANQQYTFQHYQEIRNLEEINSISRDFAKNNDMFISGGTDSHKQDIFSHHHKIDNELLNSFFEEVD